MTLPIDPTAIDPDDYGEHRVELEMDHEEAIEHVRTVFTEAGFGVPVEFSVSELLNEKVDAGRDPYHVLGACNPAIADQVLSVTRDMGGLFPCNVVIWESEPGRQVVFHVSIMRSARLVGLAPDDEEWQSVVEETSAMVEDAYAAL